MNRETFLKELTDHFLKFKDIKAIALSGSLTTEINDSNSDIDIYVYSDSELPVNFREEFIKKHSSRFEINNQFWETGDEFIVEDLNTSVDIMYRSPQWIEEQIERVWINKQASTGYSTCFLHNVVSSQIVFDADGWFLSLQEQLKTPYPEELVKNIIAKNYPILKNNISSYRFQIEKALKRNDLISINHRVTALLASYFDILFAVNRAFHPGEKKLVRFVDALCTSKPPNWEELVSQVLKLNSETLMSDIDELIDGLDRVLKIVQNS